MGPAPNQPHLRESSDPRAEEASKEVMNPHATSYRTHPDWRAMGLCAQPGADPELWFPKPGERATQARAACARCPARAACLEWALEHPKWAKFGIWGGTNDKERKAMRREQTGTPAFAKCGHPRIPENQRTDNGGCRACKRNADRSRQRRDRAA